ncbi:MAG: metallophosphoesterase family protein [Clostridia bacterium]
MTRREALVWLGTMSGSLLLTSPVRALSRLRPVRAFIPRLRAVQISDIHHGYRGVGNPDPAASVDRALALVKRLRPDVLLVSGDLIEADRAARVRERRLHEVWERLTALGIPLLAVPGEQDALMDRGSLWKQVVGPLHFHEEVRGVHVIGLDNVSRGYLLGSPERRWLFNVLDGIPQDSPVLMMAHAPLAWFYPPWNWYTYDGPAAATLLKRFPHHLFIHGHVHQVLTDAVAGIGGLGARAVSFAYPLPDRQQPVPLRPLPMPDQNRNDGLGVRLIEFSERFRVTDHVLVEPVILGARTD